MNYRAWSWTSTPPWSPATPRGNRPPPPTSTASATTHCSASSTTPARPSQASCGRATPKRTPQPTTSPSPTKPSRRPPDAHRHGTQILVRADSAGGAKAFLALLRALRRRGIQTAFSVGHTVTEQVRKAIQVLPDPVWHPALEQDGTLSVGAEVAELTGLADLTGYPGGTRIIVRRERPHPGAQLSLFDQDEGMRHQAFLTDTPVTGGSLQDLEIRHRAHVRVQDHIRCGKTIGFGRFPSRRFAINQAWLELSLTAIDLLAWTRTLLLNGELATAEPKKLRYRLLHTAARTTRGARRLRLRIAATWPWRHELTTAVSRLVALPRPAT